MTPRAQLPRGDLGKLLLAAERAGARLERTRRGHWKVYVGDDGLIVVSPASTDRNVIAHVRSALRRAGLTL